MGKAKLNLEITKNKNSYSVNENSLQIYATGKTLQEALNKFNEMFNMDLKLYAHGLVKSLSKKGKRLKKIYRELEAI